MIRALVALLVAAGLACAAAPAAQRSHAIAAGVHVGDVRVGGMLAVPARDRLVADLNRPLAVAGTTVAPRALGARVDVNAAVSAALAATPGSRIALPVHVSSAKIDRVVASLAKRVDKPAQPARVIGATDAGPQFSKPQAGVAVDRDALRAALVQALATRTPVQLVTHPVAARPFSGAVIVVNRSENTLRLFDGTKLVRTFPVATGQAIYPTPAGVWFIEDKQMNPWWYPPT